MRIAFLSIFSGLFWVHLTVAQPQIVQDVQATPAGIFGPNQAPENNFALAPTSNLLFFPASDHYGKEVWRTDGTEEGTFRITDVNPGHQNSFVQGTTLGEAYVFATSPAPGQVYTRLWKTDGTREGTLLLGNVAVNNSPASLNAIMKFTDRLLFVVSQGPVITLFQYDGTAMTLLKQVKSDPEYAFSFITQIGDQYLIGIQHTLEFDSEYEIWKTDGTALGTVATGVTPHSLVNATRIGNEVLFRDSNGSMLLKMNLSTGAVTPVHNFGGTYINRILPFGTTKSLIAANDGVYVTDGTDANTQLILPNVGTVNEALTIGAIAYFKGISSIDNKDRLYSTDGTPGGTQSLAITGDATNYGLFEGLPTLALLGNSLVCRMGSVSTGSEVGAVSLSGGGAVIKDIRSGVLGSEPNSFSLFRNELYFVANDGANGFELWKTNGTAGGTTIVRNAATGSGDGVTENRMYALNGEVYFTGGNKPGQWIWKTNGAGSGAEEFTDLSGGATIAASPDTLFYVSQRKVFKTSGLSGGTKLIADLSAASIVDPVRTGDAHFFIGDKLIYNMVTAGGALSYGFEYWTVDWHVPETQVLKDIYTGLQDGAGGPNDADVQKRAIKISSTQAVFAARNSSNGKELWITDGTTAGTTMVKDINPGAAWSDPRELSAVRNGYVYFTADDGVHGAELWKSDGTDAGTVLVKDVDPTEGSSVSNIVVMDDAIYFTAQVSGEGWGLYKTDGTAAGTARVKLFNAFPKTHKGPSSIAAIDHKLYISAEDNSSGHELWVSDGTTGGTYIIDIVEGSVGSDPGVFYEFNNELYFRADNKLWHSKGTAVMTQWIADVEPRSFLKSGSLLYMVAVSPEYGTELFKMPAKKYEQTIDFADIATQILGTGDLQLTATASSGLPVAFSSDNTNIEITNSSVKFLNIGEVTITATQPGNSVFETASVERTFCVVSPQPEITLNMATPFTPILQSSAAEFNEWFLNGEPIPGATQQTLEVVKAGSYTLKITKGGCSSAPSEARVINKLNQTITLDVPVRKFEDGNFKLTATSNAGLPITYASTSATISLEGDQVIVKSPGTTTITASSEGNELIAPATMERTFCINPAKPTVSASPVSNIVMLTSSYDANNQWYLDNAAIAGSTAKTISPIVSGNYSVEVTVNGCKTMSDVTPLLVTGLEDTSEFSVYPNPVVNTLFVSWPMHTAEVEILDAQGRLMDSATINQSHSFNVEHYSRDIYFIRLKSSDQVLWRKFIKN